MGIQINGETDIISASDDSLTINGVNLNVTGIVTATEFVTTNLNATGIVTATEFVGNGTVPPGTLIFHCANSAPSGFLKANGANVSRSTYSALFAGIGTAFGVGDGSTTFTLPDMRGEFPRGWDDGRGVDSGRSFGNTQTDAMQGHKHQTNRSVTMRVGGDGGIDWDSRRSDANDASHYDLASQMRAAPVQDGTNGTPRTASETRPRNIALLACIKY